MVFVAAGAFAVASGATAAAVAWPGGGAPATASASAVPARYEAALRSQELAAADAVRVSATAKAEAARQFAAEQAAAQAAAKTAAAKAAAAKAAAAKAAVAKAAAARAAAKAAAARAAASAAQAKKQAQQALANAESSGTPQQIAAAMLGQFGWSGDQMSCLRPLWQHESGWQVTAENPGSGAYGIPQALPGSKMASAGADWQTSASTQIKWGLGYIKDLYGSPCGAWAHEEADGWY